MARFGPLRCALRNVSKRVASPTDTDHFAMPSPLNATDAKMDLFRTMARMGQAFASPQRLQMLGLLGHATRTVEELARMTGQSDASASAHLKVLRAAGLVITEKLGRHQHCRIASNSVMTVFLAMRVLGEELMPEVREMVERFFNDPASLSPLDAKELKAELKAGRIRLIDLRPVEEFEAGRIPEAESLPFSEIGRGRLVANDDREIVAYCRGPYCLMALQGVASLRARGFAARRLALSVPEWEAAGYRLQR